MDPNRLSEEDRDQFHAAGIAAQADLQGGGDSGDAENPVTVPEDPTIFRLQRARSRYACLSAERQMVAKAFEEEHKALFLMIKTASEEVAALEESVRALALERWATTGDTKGYTGTQVKWFTRYEYDKGEALRWAIDHKIALQLDVKGFEAILKASAATPVEFAKRIDEPKATIATDLEKALGGKV